MIEYYPQIKWTHVTMVVSSGSLFFLRGLFMLVGSRSGMSAPVRYLSYGIDTLLLTTALMLAMRLRQYPFVDGWLSAKVLLLMVYIVLGSYALKRGKSLRARAIYLLAAVCVYGLIISVALTRHPLGILRY